MRGKNFYKEKKERCSLRKSDKMQKAEAGLEKIVGAHERALAQNSKDVVEILELLAKRTSLSDKNKKELRKIKNEIKGMDKKLDCIDSLNNLRNSAVVLEAKEDKVIEQEPLDFQEEDIMEESWYEL